MASSVTLLISNPYRSNGAFTLVVDASSTVGQLKDRIRQADGSLTGAFELWDRIVELEDHRKICEYHLDNRTELQVVPGVPATAPPFVAPPEQNFVPALDPTLLSYGQPRAPACTAHQTQTLPANADADAAPTATSSRSGTQKKTLTMRVTVYEKEKELTMEVYPGTKVAELRKWLERLGATVGLELPENGYFFIHNQNVMDEEYSFRWHELVDGDTVEVFPGSVGDRVN